MRHEYFWEQVKNICRKTNITQNELAQICGVPLSTFKGWIQKNYFPTVIDGYIIAERLGVSVEYLVTGKDNSGRNKMEDIRILLCRAEEELRRMV